MSHGPDLSLGWTEPAPSAQESAETRTVAPTDGAPAQSVGICPPVSERGPPEELTARDQWVVFKLESDPKRPEKPKKVPYCSLHRKASHSDPATWLTYGAAVALAKQQGFAGIGYVFSADDPYTGTDFDGVRDPVTGTVAAWVWQIVQDTNSYTEVSPSGTGLHVISRAALKDGALKTKAVEVYDRERFFTITGRVVDDYATIREAQAVVDAVVAKYRSKVTKTAAPLPPPRNTDLDDKAVVELILRSPRARDFHRLSIAGETRPNQSESESDFFLACMFAEQLGGDVERIERLMRDSALSDRKKWDRKDYLVGTIRMAIRAAGQPTAETSQAAAEPLRRLSVATLAKNPSLLTAPAMLLPRLVWAGRGTLFAGREKDGKTTYAAWAVVQAVKAGLRVLWLSTDEDQATIISRFVHLVEQGLGITNPANRDALLDRIDVLDRDPASWEEVEAQHVAGWRPDVYVVDTLSSFLMAVDGKVPETSEGEAWQAKVKRFKTWVETTTAGVLLLVHSNRADGTYRGSTGIGAALDAIVTMYGGLPDHSTRRLERKGRHGIGNDKVTIRYSGDEHPNFEEVASAKKADKAPDDPDQLGKKVEQAFGVFYKAGLAGLDYTTWESRIMAALDCADRTAQRHICALTNTGFVVKDEATGSYRLTDKGREYGSRRTWNVVPPGGSGK